MELEVQFRIVKDGGGSLLTPEARELIKNYRDFYREAEASLDLLYKKYFPSI